MTFRNDRSKLGEGPLQILIAFTSSTLEVLTPPSWTFSYCHVSTKVGGICGEFFVVK